MGSLTMLVILPLLLLWGVLFVLALAGGGAIGIVLAVALLIVVLVLAFAASSAAHVVFTAVLHNYATGKSLPAGIDASSFGDAFRGPQL